MKKVLSILLVLALVCIPLAACDSGGGGDAPATTPPPTKAPDSGNTGGDTAKLEDVTLRLWGGEEDQAMLRERADTFISSVADKVNLTIEIGVESESTVKDTILTDTQAAADVFAFADDQIFELYNGGALQKVELNVDAIKAANVAGSVDAASIDGVLYAYPLTADNGYFLFYNSEYLSEADTASWEKMMDAAAAEGKYVTHDMANGWFSIGWFRAAGLDAWIGPDGSSSETNINKAGGVDVVNAMLNIAKHKGFFAKSGDEVRTGIADGIVIAFVSGPWDTEFAKEIWGDNAAATKLPTLNIAGADKQMGGVLGCKLMGVNAFSANVGWAMQLAEFLTNEESQLIRLELRSQGPSNINAAKSPLLQENIGLAAIAKQAAFSGFFAPGGNYWEPMGALCEIIRNGNPNNEDIQKLLDNAVAGITAS